MADSLKNQKQESWKTFDQIAGTYDLVNRLISFGIDRRWRAELLKHLPTKMNLRALDLATGTGDIAFLLARNPRVANVIGMDLSKEMMAHGKQKMAQFKLKNKIEFMEGDGVSIPLNDASVDLVTLVFGIRNFPDPLTSLKSIHRVLHPKGRVLIMEFSIPYSRIWRTLYFFYLRKILPKIGGLVSGHPKAYNYLNQTIEEFPSGENFSSMLRSAGFHSIHRTELSWGIATLYRGHK